MRSPVHDLTWIQYFLLDVIKLSACSTIGVIFQEITVSATQQILDKISTFVKVKERSNT